LLRASSRRAFGARTGIVVQLELGLPGQSGA